MNRVLRVAGWITGLFLMMVGALFLVLEGRLLLSGDWRLYAVPAFGCVQYLLRIGLAAFALVVGWKGIRPGSASVQLAGICLTVASVGMLPFLSGTGGWLLPFLAVCFLLTHRT